MSRWQSRPTLLLFLQCVLEVKRVPVDSIWCYKGWLSICGFMRLINFVTFILFFLFHALSLLLKSLFFSLRARLSQLNFNSISFLNGEMQYLLTFARLVLFTSLKSKTFPLCHANINLHCMTDQFQVRSSSVLQIPLDQYLWSLPSWGSYTKMYYTSSDGVTM